MATSEAVPKLKETASRAAKSTGFEPSVEETGSMHDLVLEEQQTASQGFEAKKEEQFLRRERQRGVSCKMMVVFKWRLTFCVTKANPFLFQFYLSKYLKQTWNYLNIID